MLATTSLVPASPALLAATPMPDPSPGFASRLFEIEASFDPKADGLTEPEWPEAFGFLAQLLATCALAYAQLPARHAVDEIGRLLAGARPETRAELAVLDHVHGELLDLL